MGADATVPAPSPADYAPAAVGVFNGEAVTRLGVMEFVERVRANKALFVSSIHLTLGPFQVWRATVAPLQVQMGTSFSRRLADLVSMRGRLCTVTRALKEMASLESVMRSELCLILYETFTVAMP